MSVYSELLRIALAEDSPPDESIGDLVSRAVTLRPTTGPGVRSADRIADWLAYDVALVRLCERLDVAHGLLEPDAGPATRAAAEAHLVARIPSLAEALGIG